MIEYEVEYFSIKQHENTVNGDLLYVANLEPNGQLTTHIVQVSGFRQEYNPFHTQGKGPKFHAPEYLVSFVFYKYKSFIHKILSKKSIVTKERFWVPNAFFRKTEIDAKAALLTHISKDKVETARSIFELENPGFLDKFDSREYKTRFNTNKILNFFSQKKNEELNDLSNEDILEKISFE